MMLKWNPSLLILWCLTYLIIGSLFLVQASLNGNTSSKIPSGGAAAAAKIRASKAATPFNVPENIYR